MVISFFQGLCCFTALPLTTDHLTIGHYMCGAREHLLIHSLPFFHCWCVFAAVAQRTKTTAWQLTLLSVSLLSPAAESSSNSAGKPAISVAALLRTSPTTISLDSLSLISQLLVKSILVEERRQSQQVVFEHLQLQPSSREGHSCTATFLASSSFSSTQLFPQGRPVSSLTFVVPFFVATSLRLSPITQGTECKISRDRRGPLCVFLPQDNIMTIIFRALNLNNQDHCMFWAACIFNIS